MSFQQLLCLCALILPTSAFAIYGDARPDAPDLAAPGELHIGVRTEHLTHHNQLDILAGHPYDRPLQVEIWYPATLAKGQQPGTVYTDK